MEFKVGNHKTRDGSDAAVVIDWREHGVDSGYPLEGYIVRDGRKYVDNWTPDGRNNIDKEHPNDLMPPAPRRLEGTIYIYDLDEVIQKMSMGSCETISVRPYRTGYRNQAKVKITIEEVFE